MTRQIHLTEKDIARFWSKVDIRGNNECWLWKTVKYTNGYGQFTINSKAIGAHRIAWQIANGRNPRNGFEIAHAPVICHTPLCCNPSHLNEKTRKENNKDRHLDGTTPRGEKHGRAKITKVQMNQIRELRKQGIVLRIISKIFGVSCQQVHRIASGEQWKK